MKELCRYKCELCGEVYEVKAECEECEKKHKRPAGIIGVAYNYLSRFPTYPDRIAVEMEDGTTKFYRAE